MERNRAWLQPDPEIDPEALIRSFFVDNEARKWIFVYLEGKATVSVTDFREVMVNGITIDDPVHLLTAYSKTQTLFRITTYDPASDWLWACFRATRDLRKMKGKNGHSGTPVRKPQPGVIRKKKRAKKARKGRR
jgi:hypothetical protein